MNTPNRITLLLPMLFALAGLVALGWLVDRPAQAAPLATWYVAPGGDDANDCLSPATACATIGAAVGKASDDDTIQIAAGTYDESNILINRRLKLIGADAATTIVDAGQNGRVFTLSSDSTLRHLTIRNGQTVESGSLFTSGGGGVVVGSGAHARLQHVVIRDNTASGSSGVGGGIFNAGFLTIDHTRIISNYSGGGGGGIYHYPPNGGAITITHALIADNEVMGTAASLGGGISTGRPLFIRDSVIRNNSTVASSGGGIFGGGAGTEIWLERVTIADNQSVTGAGVYVQGEGNLTLLNSTVSGNVASNNRAGVYGYAIGADVTITISNTTITGNSRTNTAGTGWNGVAVGNNATATLYNSIIAHNMERQCTNGVTSLGHNLSSDFHCNLTQPGDQPNEDPLLMPLDDYGGATPTHALRPGSPAIEGGDNANCPATDQRDVARPYDGDNSGTAVCDIGAVEAEHQLTIADVSILEGTNGLTTAVFTVTLSPDHNQTVTVDYATEDGTAVSPDDYIATSGTLTFAPGVTEQTIEVSVVANDIPQPDRVFYVNLSEASNAFILIGRATGTIIDDDGLPGMSINDVSILEGNSGSQEMIFEVTLSRTSDETVTVNYETVDDTAVAPDDYLATSGTLTFDPGQTYQEISVTILGDVIDEGHSEQFFVQLSDPINADLVKDVGVGTIIDDDIARLRHEIGPSVVKPASGLAPAVFEVTLTIPAAFTVTVDYTVSDGIGENGAKYGLDYTGAITGTLTFPPGSLSQTYTLFIIGNTEAGPDKTFSSQISNASAPITANTALATIINEFDASEEAIIYLPLVIRP